MVIYYYIRLHQRKNNKYDVMSLRELKNIVQYEL